MPRFTEIRHVLTILLAYLAVQGDSDGYFLWHNVAASLFKAPRCGFYAGDYASAR